MVPGERGPTDRPPVDVEQVRLRDLEPAQGHRGCRPRSQGGPHRPGWGLDRRHEGRAVLGVGHTVAVGVGRRELVGADVDDGAAVAVTVRRGRLPVPVQGGERRSRHRRVGAGVDQGRARLQPEVLRGVGRDIPVRQDLEGRRGGRKGRGEGKDVGGGVDGGDGAGHAVVVVLQHLVGLVARRHQHGDRGGGPGGDGDLGEQGRIGEARVLGGVEVDADDLGFGEVSADVVVDGGEPQVAPQIGVADDGGGLTAAQSGGDAGRGDGVADDQGVGDTHLGVVDLGDEGVDAHAAAVAGETVAARRARLGQGVADDGVVGDLGGGLVDVQAAAEHQGGVAVHQVVGEVHVAVDHDAAAAPGGAVVLDDVAGHERSRGAVDPDAAPLAELDPIGEVVDDGVGFDAGVGGDDAGAGPLHVDAAAHAPGAGGDLIDDVLADDVADDDGVAVADVDAAAQPVGLRAGHDVAGDDVVADHGVAQHEHAAARDPLGGRPDLADAALDGAALDGEVGARAAAGAGGEDDGRASLAGGVEDGGGGAVADDVHG